MTAVDVAEVTAADAALEVPPATDGAATELAFAGTVAEALVIVVTASRGRFRPCITTPARVESGTLVGRIEGRNGRADEVRMPVRAALHGLLAWDNELVKSGQPVAWGQRVK